MTRLGNIGVEKEEIRRHLNLLDVRTAGILDELNKVIKNASIVAFHSDLQSLDYASSGHTGFASSVALSAHVSATEAHGATGAVVGTTNTQTLTNKTIDGDNNTLSNLDHGSEVDNPSSGVHGVTGDVVGTTNTQTLTNKTIEEIYGSYAAPGTDIYLQYYDIGGLAPWAGPAVEFFAANGGALVVQGTGGVLQVGSKEIHGGSDSLASPGNYNPFIFEAYTVSGTDTAAYELRYTADSAPNTPAYLFNIRQAGNDVFAVGVGGRAGVPTGNSLAVPVSFELTYAALEENDTVTGNWEFTQPITTTGGHIRGVTNVNAGASPYTVLKADDMVVCDAAAGAITVNLPNGAGEGVGWEYIIVNVAGAADDITIDAGSGRTIGGTNQTDTLEPGDRAIHLIYDGTSDWFEV